MSLRRNLVLLTLPAAALTTMAAQAADTAAATGRSADTIEEVVVTAQKREEHLVDVPISVAVVSDEKLKTAGITDMASLAQVVPSMHVDSSGAFFQPSLRGVGTAIAGAGASANVATYIDNIYQPNALSNAFEFFDIANVQVLKGPQGTLFGRNTTGGAIVVTTKSPTQEPTFDMRLGYGNFGTSKANLFASKGFTEDLAGSIAVGYSKSDGWMTNVVTGGNANPSENYSVRAKLAYKFNQNWNATLTIDAEGVDDPSLYAVNAYHGYSSSGAFFGVPMITESDSRHVALDVPITHFASNHGGNLKIVGDLGFATLTSYSAMHFDHGREATAQAAAPTPANFTGAVGGLPFAFYVVDAHWNYSQQTYSQEFDLSHYGDGPVDWVGGLFFFRDRTEYKPFDISLYGSLLPGGAFSGAAPPWPAGTYVDSGPIHNSDFGQINKSAAVFANATIKLGKFMAGADKWYLDLGARYNKDKSHEDFEGFFGGATGLLQGDKSWNDFTPRAIIRYAPSADSSVYLSYSKGTKAGLFNSSGFASQREAVNPEKLTDIEAGFKIARPTWQFEGSVFNYKYSDLQIASYVGCCAVFQNATDTKIYGGDIHWVQQVSKMFRFDVGVAYTHARYDNFPGALIQGFNTNPAANACPPGQTGAAFQLGVTTCFGDVSNGIVDRVPEFTGSFAPHLTIPAGAGTVDLDANYSFQTASSFDVGDTLKQPGYGLLNVRAAWTDPSQHWTLALAGRNVLDKKYLVQVLPNAGGFGAAHGMPTSIMATVEFRH